MKIQGIQTLRAIAAIAVVFDHAAAMAKFDKYFGEETPLYPFLTSGGQGVNLFFIISGFIIVVSSFTQKDVKPKRSLRDFLIARAIRILPMMWLAIASYAALRYLGRGTFEATPYVNAFLLSPVGDYDPNNIWTLRHEAFFYLVFGICFLTKTGKPALFIAWVGGGLLLALGEPIFAPADWAAAEALKNFFSPFNALFATGAVIGYIYLRHPAFFSPHKKWDSVPALHWILPIIFFSISMHLFKGDFKSTEVMLATTPIFAAMVFLCAINTNARGKLMTYLGNASFAIYLFHPHFESALLGALARIFPSMPVSLAVLVCGTFSIIAGCAIYSFVETPVTRRLQRAMHHSTKGSLTA